MRSKARILRMLCCLLALLLVLPVISACGGKKPQEQGKPNEANSGNGQPTNANQEDETRPYLDDLKDEDFDFDLDEFNVLSVTSESGTYTLFDVEELGAVVLDNAIFNRNREIEKRFNIVFKAHDNSYQKCYDTLQTQVNSNAADYDLIMLINRNAYSAAIAGMVMPVEKLKYLDLSKDYYLHDINEMSSINGKQFLAYSEESLYTFQRAACISFNKSIADSLELGNYYDAVDNNQWTFEKLFADAAVATTRNQDDSIDVYGMYGHYGYMFSAFFIAAGYRLIEKKGETLTFSATKNQELDTIANAVLAQIDLGNIGYNSNWTEANEYVETFNNQKALFNTTVVGKLLLQKDVKGWDYGVLPWPKYTTGQDEYYSWVVDAWLHVCLSTHTDPDRVSVILEALASGSAKWVYPAYYEHSLLGRSLRDPESVNMLEIVRYHRIFDWGMVTWSETIRKPIEDKVFLDRTMSVPGVCQSVAGVVRNLIIQAEEGAAKLGVPESPKTGA